MNQGMINGRQLTTDAPPDTPLLYVLRNEWKISSPKFGCGLAQCGSCSVLIDGVEVRSCITPISEIAGKEVTTLEGLPLRWAAHTGNAATSESLALHPVQQAWIEEQVPLCGFCQSGMMIKATELLEANPSPTVQDIKVAFTTDGPSPHLCRCGSYKAIIEAVQRAAKVMQQGGRTNAD